MTSPSSERAAPSATAPAGPAARTIVIVGGGFSGAVTAVQLLRSARQPLRVILVNESGRMARGLAYGTHNNAHVLNVPAGNMSALPEDPDDFLRYCRWSDPQVRPESFVPRRLYGAYLEALLSAAELRHEGGLDLQRVVGRVVSLAAPGADSGSGRASLRLDDGRVLQADAVVLAFGHFAPVDPLTAPMLHAAQGRYVSDPWAADALAGIGPDDDVLMVGAGLTAVDVALALQRAGHRGRLLSISRRGLAPLSHRRSGVVPSAVDGTALAAAMAAGLGAAPAGTLRGALRVLREETRRRQARGEDWRDVMAALRAHTPALWQRLTVADRARFLRHLRPYWEVLRHRCAPAAHEAHAALVASGRLALAAARLRAVQAVPASDAGEPAGLLVALQPRGGGAALQRRVQAIVNCTGPSADLRRSGSPLIAQLLADGLVAPDALGLGLQVDGHYRVLDARGAASGWLHYIGPLLKAREWEATAVPELRHHAQRLAARLTAPQAVPVAAPDPATA